MTLDDLEKDVLIHLGGGDAEKLSVSVNVATVLELITFLRDAQILLEDSTRLRSARHYKDKDVYGWLDYFKERMGVNWG